MSNQIQTVSFAGTDLFIVNQAGKPFVPMRPIVEAMGMAWQSQHEKLKTKFASTITEIVTVAQDGKQRELTCLPLAKIAGWLYSVSPNKVAPEIREKVIQYQNECDTALFDYWTKGVAVKPSEAATPEQSQHIKSLVSERVRTTGKNYQTVWNEVFEAAGFNKLDRLTEAAYHRALDWFNAAPKAASSAAPQLECKELDMFYIGLLAALDVECPQKGFMTEHMAQRPENVTSFTQLMPYMKNAVAAFKQTITPVTPLPVQKPSNEVSIETWKLIDLNRDLRTAMRAIDSIADRVGGIGMLKSDLPDAWWHGKRLAV